MSGLEKFQDNPAWRKKLLSHLLTDRPLPTPTKSPKESMEQRHSLDIVLDFEALMKARKEELDELEKRDEARTTSALNVNSESEVMFKCGEDSQLQDADESFDAFERMCDKTASDPDNTLFQYLNSDDKDHVLALAKERSARADKSSDMEIDALRRLLDDVSCQDQLDNESPLKGVECTQLEDIEAPSRLWDNDFTINCNDSVLRTSAKTSPVKMVGLLRPSTILEANEADLTGYQSDGSSNNNSSFQTAATLKTAHSFETIASGSSCYETAANNSLASSTREAPTLNVDDLFYAAIAKAKPHGMSKGEEQELLIDLHETLIDLVANKPSESILSDGAENTIIELSSSDEEDFKVDIKLEDTSLSEAGIEIEENKENKSIHFNDTMEEMEYMMQKGLEYMAAKAALTTPNTPTKPLSDANITNPKNLSKQNTFVLTPKNIPSSPMRQGTNSGNRKLPQSSSSSRYAINMDKPMGKFFKLPSAIPMRRHLKPQKDQFAHIVSPIRTYTHKSGTAPLMSMFRQTCSQNINDAFHKLSIHELEQESRLCQLKRTHETSNVNPTKLSSDCIDSNARLLPKKAYISSELKQVVDERTPMPMPNVPKIQKYLNSAVEPTVLRHDGKMKMPDQSGRSAHSQIPRRPNQSLADLSLASGDISLYTIKDAQKF